MKIKFSLLLLIILYFLSVTWSQLIYSRDFVYPGFLLTSLNGARYNLTSFILSSNQGSGNARTLYFPKTVEMVKNIPARENIWVFILAGQSNMAGRGMVEPQDTIPDYRIFSVNDIGKLVYAKEPLHFNEPKMAGLDCGLSFAKRLIKHLPDSISILVLPAAVGGSSISQWLGDSLHRNVKLLTGFREMVETGKKYGIIKGILWHQGESDANEKDIPLYKKRLAELIAIFRKCIGNDSLPVLIGRLGSFSKNDKAWDQINKIIRQYSAQDKNTLSVSTHSLKDKGDRVHFNSEGQRKMGQRFAKCFIRVSKNKNL